MNNFKACRHRKVSSLPVILNIERLTLEERKTGTGKEPTKLCYIYSRLQSLETMPGAEQAAFSQTRTSTNRLSSSRELLWFLRTRFS
ncbi:hypothetical protein SRHO_G00287170 [Serrasalmus rhombeus]